MTDIRQQWQEQGYLVIKGAFDLERVAALRAGAEDARAQWNIEGAPESEPGGFGHGPTAWIMLHLNHPRYYRRNPKRLTQLLNAVGDAQVQRILREIFRDEATLLQANLYVDPSQVANPSAWHRDCQFYLQDVKDEAAERRVLSEEADPPRELHMHIPLAPTAASEVVPGSHRRWDTPAERHIRLHDRTCDAMPGALRLQLEPGDLAFFHVNALHRGLYQPGVLRRTIAVTYSRADFPRPATPQTLKERLGYVPSYQPWFLRPNYLDGTEGEPRAFYDRFIETYRETWKPEFLSPEIGEKRIRYFWN